jgi:outer membrane protein assembly factor BamB
VKRGLIAAAAAAVLAAGAAGAYVLVKLHEGRDIHGSSAQFQPGAPTGAAESKLVPWPTYGADPERLRVANGVDLAPPFRTVWTFHARSLVEFPPAVGYGRLYFANNDGVLYAISAATGRRAWSYASHRCQAMSPALAAHVVYATFLNRPPCNASGGGLDGELVALSAATGKVLWEQTIGPSESSPVVVGGRLYVGDWSGRVSCYEASGGRLLWSFQAGGEVKGAIAVAGGTVYFGAYDSHVYALDAATGKLLWRASAQPRLGHAGEFYATAAVAYGRVYIGATDGKEYSFGAATGDLVWSHSTGGYVYSSAAVWRRRVYVGSYSDSLLCLDAATGDELWSFRANGPISGSPTIVAGRVYFSTLNGETYALGALDGKQQWTFPDGKYSPVVADRARLYLTGYARVYGLVESRR